jgi:hypothetical protein
MNGESCRRYKPAVIVGRSDTPLLVEQSDRVLGSIGADASPETFIELDLPVL